MKRFYKNVDVAGNEAAGFSVLLDQKPIKTPNRNLLISPTRKLAEKIAAEWQAQAEKVDPETMPLTQIVTTAVDTDSSLRQSIENEILGYLNTDLLFYRAREPEAVARRQAAAWDPWVEWFALASGATIEITTDLSALAQPDSAHAYAAGVVRQADSWRFTALQMATALGGSLVLALAFTEGILSPEDFFAAAQVEELYRNEIYNESFHGQAPHQARAHADLRRNLAALQVYLDSLS